MKRSSNTFSSRKHTSDVEIAHYSQRCTIEILLVLLACAALYYHLLVLSIRYLGAAAAMRTTDDGTDAGSIWCIATFCLALSTLSRAMILTVEVLALLNSQYALARLVRGVTNDVLPCKSSKDSPPPPGLPGLRDLGAAVATWTTDEGTAAGVLC